MVETVAQDDYGRQKKEKVPVPNCTTTLKRLKSAFLGAKNTCGALSHFLNDYVATNPAECGSPGALLVTPSGIHPIAPG